MTVKQSTVIAWWSGGVTSAVACKLAIDLYGEFKVRLVFINTNNEDDDTQRFKLDCEKWYGKEIETISNKKYAVISDVWYEYNSLNTANGAICSDRLKREVRIRFQRENPYVAQVFGFDIDEPKRAKAMALNYPEACPVFPLLYRGYTKRRCIDVLTEAGIEIPRAYKLGFKNNNCLKTGCVQGGIGYWQKMRIDFPDRFDAMAKVEHDLTNQKGKPVTMLKTRSGALIFLKPHPDYPDIIDISMVKGRKVNPLVECNGYCGTNDLSKRNPTEEELNYEPLP